ncbi:ABC transporter G family member 23-like [Panonychus citri]|uniref:ABC transporter G family member 23-like n=1 Tax=Panonychus citri TaxID=50023 RepID=UPI0023080D7F|nr:ABC transporter G family member 23-like [Panonychus citri]
MMEDDLNNNNVNTNGHPSQQQDDLYHFDDKIWQEGLIARNLCYAIKNVDILNNVDLNLARGQIYGLLGPSGCGKTTLLRCFIGSIIPQVGDLFIFGHRPYDFELGIPGPRLGYMPQEIALHGNLTTYENAIYFGLITQMSRGQLTSRIDYLLDLLNLTPFRNYYVRQLSGGQARRVSLLVTLIHEPPLIILDEPTVGVDPLLRETCWSYLVNLAETKGCTIIVSTHYIEEARRAHRIGFMRKGRIIVEDEPNQLMSSHKATSLETVFLNLCSVKRKSTMVNPRDLKLFQQRMAREGKNITLGHNPYKTCFPCLLPGPRSLKTDQSKASSLSSLLKIWFTLWLGLTRNNIRNEFRDPLVLCCQYLVSIWMILLFYFGIGNPPSGIRMAFVNEDSSFFSLSGSFIDSLDSQMFIKQPYQSFNEAITDARSTPFWGVLWVPSNFTETLLLDKTMADVSIESIQSGQMKISVDMANKLVSAMCLRSLVNGFISFIGDTMKSFGLDERLTSSPIVIDQVIYGKNVSRDYNDFRRTMFPGFVINVTLTLSMAVSSIGLIQLRKSNTFERLLVSGLTKETILLVHCATRIFLTIPFVAVVTCLQFWLIGVDYPESLGIAFLVYTLQIILGIVAGIVLSGLSKEVVASLYAVSGFFIVFLVSTGSIWPIEAISPSFRWICFCLPGTGSVEAYRSSIYRGWGLGHPKIWPGICIDTLWLIGTLIIGLKVFK